MNTHTIGIDFGTYKTLVSHINPQTNTPETIRLGVGRDYIPTTVYIDSEGVISFGDEADDMLEDCTGRYLRGFKMQLGSSTPLHLYFESGQPRMLTAKDLVKMYLQHIRQRVLQEVYHGEPVTAATITRPANFSPAQLEELKQAALAAGFEAVSFATEPEAAGLAFCRQCSSNAFKHSALVVDWGGGTLDFALVSRHGDTICTHSSLTGGDTTMGGEKFDERLWLFVTTELKKKGVGNLSHISQLPRVRKAKEVLSSKANVTLYLSGEDGACPPLGLSRTVFNTLIADDVEKATQQVAALIKRIPAEHKPEMLLLVGGSSQIPYIQEQMSMASGLPARSWHLSHEAVALGAAMWMLTKSPQTDESVEFQLEKGKERWAYAQYQEASKWYEKAAKQGNAEAQYLLARCYTDGQGKEKDLKKGAKWLSLAAEQGHAEAQCSLAGIYYMGLGIPQDIDEAIRWLKCSAAQNHIGAQAILAKHYTQEGKYKNIQEGIKWLRIAAEQGHIEAQHELGRIYSDDEGENLNLDEAIKWFKKSASSGYANAQLSLGFCYATGKGVPKNLEEACKLFRQAAEQGHAEAQWIIGLHYERGLGVKQDEEAAFHWYVKAATQEDTQAQYRLANLYLNGIGTSENSEIAAQLYYLAARKGHADAQYMLGLCYAQGVGIEQDKDAAKFWIHEAANNGQVDAVALILKATS